MEYNNIVSKLPNFLIEKLNLQYNEEITKKIIEGYGQRRVSSFRVNTLKSNVCKIEKILIENKKDLENFEKNDPNYDRLFLTEKRIEQMSFEIVILFSHFAIRQLKMFFISLIYF